ncbi:MAG: flagellar hook-basal body complex protein [Rhodospirillales bacterium]|nr:flagellar hook-basal body complex protein [Rhodospirillales bacterium]
MTVFNGYVSPTLGMMAQAHALNTIGINLANVNTGGFKSTETRFSTILSDTVDKQSDLGGVKPKDHQKIAQQGFIVSSPGNLDLAINGRGFFIVNTKFNGSGETLYTRDGSFAVATEGTEKVTVNGASVDIKKAYLVDKNGYFVQGLGRDSTTGTFPLSATLTPLRIDQFAFSNTGEATSTADLRLNLPANDTPSTAQVDTVTLAGTVGALEAGDVYSVTVDGTTVSYTTTGAEANLDAVRDGLVAAINANATVGAIVTAAAGTTGKLNLTAKNGGVAFTASSSATNGGATADNAATLANSVTNAAGSVQLYNIDVFDSKGQAQSAALKFTKGSAVNQWSVTATNSRTPVAQVETVTLGGTVGALEAGDQYSVTVGGNTVTYTTTGLEANLDAVRDGLVAKINADGTVGKVVTAAAGAAGALTLTAKSAGDSFTATSATVNGGATADNTANNSTTTANVTSTVTSAPTTMTFDPTGAITSPTSLSLAFTFAGGGTASVALDVSGITQYAGDFTPFLYTKNGFAATDMTRVTFDGIGQVIGVFDNATDRPIYKIPLAQFANPNALQMKNGNVFAESEDSGSAKVVVAGAGGFATFLPNSREISNVDMADEFTRMIVTQTAYNSSASVFRAVDEMTQTARDLKR